MNIILDFDHTLFNAEEFKQALRDRLALFEISSGQFDDSYRAITEKVGYYNYQEHLKTLAQENNLDENDLLLSFQEIIDFTKEFLYPSTTVFLKNLKKFPANTLYLLTFGQNDFQQAKINASGIKEYFDEVYDIQKSKVEFFKANKDFISCILVDDRGKEIDQIKKKYPKVKAIWLKRKDSRYYKEKCQLKNYQAKNLNEVLNFIKTIINN